MQQQLKSWVEPEIVMKKFLKYQTQFHSIRVSDKTIDSYAKRIGKVSKKGKSRYTDEERHLMLCQFVIHRSRPKGLKMSGSDWELSMRSLLWEVFKEDWDKDHNKVGEDKTAQDLMIADLKSRSDEASA